MADLLTTVIRRFIVREVGYDAGSGMTEQAARLAREIRQEHLLVSPVMEQLNDEELSILHALVRNGLRRASKERKHKRNKFGDGYNDASLARRIRVMKSMFAKIGGDPERIWESLGREE